MMYVALSKVQTSGGLFVWDKVITRETSEELKQMNDFHDFCMRTKSTIFNYDITLNNDRVTLFHLLNPDWKLLAP